MGLGFLTDLTENPIQSFHHTASSVICFALRFIPVREGFASVSYQRALFIPCFKRIFHDQTHKLSRFFSPEKSLDRNFRKTSGHFGRFPVSETLFYF
ncbi:hypothetical protein LptCag_1078 [Leptospirillum ferriphilum]|uniref:Uncharacterized protein n=1 Tax=Leptospirillum ferriphilum TaxID=178606 RepID=A0A094WCS5_9BACT|nr:hypothetical protein LptCag_1078 [Leptospirillum ferriphilum]